MEPKRPATASHTTEQVNGQPAMSAAWSTGALLVARWKLIAGVAAACTFLAVVIALSLPRYYAAEARVLRPNPTALSSLLGLGDVGAGGLGRLLTAGGGGDYTRYLAILNSRTLREELIERFDLVAVYDVGDKRYPVEAALGRLEKNLSFPISPEFGHLTVAAYDRDPERAAAMANFLVEELNRRHSAMTADNARLTRVFVEQRLNQARASMDSLRTAMQAFQEQHGIVELESQAQAFMGAMAAQSGRVAEFEVRYRTLLQQYGPENPQVIAARDALAAARQQLRGAFGGAEALLPLAVRDMPAASRQYAHLLQEQMIQAQIMETIYPLYEQARFQELSETRAVQVLDHAFVPTEPARPSRRLIVLVAAFTGFFAGALFVLGQAWIRDNHTLVATRLQLAAPSSRAPEPATQD